MLHLAFMSTTVLALCFSTNILHLCALLLVVSITFLSNVALQNCPITVLEERFLGTSIVHEYQQSMRAAGLSYTTASTYEMQVDALVTTFSMVAVKLMGLVAVRGGAGIWGALAVAP